MALLPEQFFPAETVERQVALLEEAVAYRFRDRNLPLRALTHRSVFESGTGIPVAHNERLEFLGDAVVNWLVVDELYRRYPDESEGKLSQLKGKFVGTGAFSRCAVLLGLPDLLLMSRSAERGGARERPNIQEDLFEAVMGALYLDGGSGEVHRILEQVLFSQFDRFAHSDELRNWKGELNELLQRQGKGVAEFRVASVIGPQHDQTFVVEVLVEGEPWCSGTGKSKLAAEQSAAERCWGEMSEREDREISE